MDRQKSEPSLRRTIRALLPAPDETYQAESPLCRGVTDKAETGMRPASKSNSSESAFRTCDNRAINADEGATPKSNLQL
jgi:hypothetical protein